jgi:hypothetical protein
VPCWIQKIEQVDLKIKPYLHTSIVEKLYNEIKVSNIIVKITQMDEMNGYLRLEIVDPWDPMEFKYKNVIVEGEEEMAICKSACFIKLLDYGFKFNRRAKCSYICFDGLGKNV